MIPLDSLSCIRSDVTYNKTSKFLSSEVTMNMGNDRYEIQESEKRCIQLLIKSAHNSSVT